MPIRDWHNTSDIKLPPYYMLQILSQSRQSCLSRFEQRGQVRGAMLLQTPSQTSYYKPAQIVHHH